MWNILKTILGSSISPDTEADLAELHLLQTWLNELPRDLFVNKLLLDYSKSETKLEHSRQMLFNILGGSEDFPFHVNSELKRRINTRNGDSADVKLAYDIHTVLTVVEGENSRKSSAVPTIAVRHNDKCQCKEEITHLKSTVASLQADILLIKQRSSVSENTRIDDMKHTRCDEDIRK